MKKTYLGILLGAIAGVIDTIPMILQKLSWDANLSAFSFWLICGFFIANSKLQIKSAPKGAFISLLFLIPLAIIIGTDEPFTLIPIFSMTLMLGSALGFFIDKYGR